MGSVEEHLQPKVCVQTSTSAGLEQILPWLFYHKVVGVAQFLLFVEGKAAKPNVAGVLESIPVSRKILCSLVFLILYSSAVPALISVPFFVFMID
jgi:hypothetical protein